MPRQAGSCRSCRTLERMRISASGLHLQLQARRRADDEDWCRVQVVAQVNGFQGEFEAWLQAADLERFANAVDRMYESVGQASIATLSSAEPYIEVTLTMRQLGGIHGRYKLESERRDGAPTVLSGAFEIDQSFLP